MKRIASSMILPTMISAAAFAADAGSSRIRLDSAVKVGSTELPAGDYKITRSGSGDNRPGNADARQDQSHSHRTARGSAPQYRRNLHPDRKWITSLTEIQFRDKTLVLHEAASQAAGQQASGKLAAWDCGPRLRCIFSPKETYQECREVWRV